MEAFAHASVLDEKEKPPVEKRDVRDREGSVEAARTGRWNLTTASGSRASSGSFPLARTISRVGAHRVWRARQWSGHPSSTRGIRHCSQMPHLDAEKSAGIFRRDSALFFIKGEDGGRHWTRARHERWSTWTGSRTLRKNPMSPRINAICTRTSEVRFTETAAVLGQRPTSACAFRERRVGPAKGAFAKTKTSSRLDTSTRYLVVPTQYQDVPNVVLSRTREPLTRAPRSLPPHPPPPKFHRPPQSLATRPKMTSRRHTARWRKSRIPINTPPPSCAMRPLGHSTR